jgi:hypothetical protein
VLVAPRAAAAAARRSSALLPAITAVNVRLLNSGAAVPAREMRPMTKRLVDGVLQGNRTALSRSITLSTLRSRCCWLCCNRLTVSYLWIGKIGSRIVAEERRGTGGAAAGHRVGTAPLDHIRARGLCGADVLPLGHCWTPRCWQVHVYRDAGAVPHGAGPQGGGAGHRYGLATYSTFLHDSFSSPCCSQTRHRRDQEAPFWATRRAWRSCPMTRTRSCARRRRAAYVALAFS